MYLKKKFVSLLDVGSYDTSPKSSSSKEYCLPETPRKSGLKRRLSDRFTSRSQKRKYCFIISNKIPFELKR